MTYYDDSVDPGTLYQYRVEGVLPGGVAELIGDSEWISEGLYKPLDAPDSISILRAPEGIVLKWSIDESKTITSMVERSENGGPFSPLFGHTPVCIKRKK